MNTALTDPSKTPMDNFKAALTDKIAKEAGSIMPDDVLEQLISESVLGMIKTGMDGGSNGKGWIRQEIETILAVQVREHVMAIVGDETFLREAVKEIFNEVVPTVLMRAVSDAVSYNIEQRIRNMMPNGGF